MMYREAIRGFRLITTRRIFAMKTIITTIIISLGVFALAGCESLPVGKSYEVSAANILKIKRTLEPHQKVSSVFVEYAEEYQPELICRLVGTPDFGNGKTIPEYISDAFIQELWHSGNADVSDNRVHIEINEISFSTLADAHWSIGVDVDSNTHKGFSVSLEREFKSSFSGINACKNVSTAFHGLVRELIHTIVGHPQFPKLIK